MKTHRAGSVLALLAFVFFVQASQFASAALTVDGLRCQYADTPLNLDVPQPQLNWTLASDVRGDHPLAFQVLVASSWQLLGQDHGDLWDSGRVAAADTLSATYAGQPLGSAQACFWKVRAWDKDNQSSAWSAPASWTMGMLSAGDRTGQWIGQAPLAETSPANTDNSAPTNPTNPTTQPASGPTTRPMPLLRRRFVVDKPLRRAMIYLCGLGQFDLHVNGRAVSEDLLQPGWTDYRKTCLYVAYDITSQLRQGSNAVAVVLGNGMYNVPPIRYHKFTGSFGDPMLIAQIHLDFADATAQSIATDGDWKVASGPITFSSIYGGEDYDARLARAGWDEPDFSDSDWTPATILPAPGGRLVGSSRSAPPIRVARILEPQKVTQVRPDAWVYDLGQNCAVIPRITVRGPAGTQVRLTPGELLARDGTVTQTQSGRGCYYQYTLSAESSQTWSPRFCYYGARFIQLQGLPPQDVKLQGLFITSTSPAVGEFTTSNVLFSRTNTLIDWAMRSNMMSILTDCPHREKLGWLEQDHLMGDSLLYNFDIAPLLNKICGDMSDAQHDNGLVPDIAPEYVKFQNGFLDSPEWGSAAVLVPWSLYQWYGDLSALRSNYDMMRRYVAYLTSKADSNLLNFGLGDWYDLGPKRPGVAQLTPIALTATAFYYRDLTILQKTAGLLHHPEAAAEYARQADAVRQAFNAKFYDALSGRYATGSQTAQAIPLVFGLARADDRDKVLSALVADVRSRDDALTAGDVGYRYVLRALADGNRSDVIYDMNRRSDRPGYGYQLEHGATSLTEAWDTDPRSSQDHFMLGHIMEWFYSDLAGIQRDDAAPGFAHVFIKPHPVGDIASASASYDSIRGLISSSWKRDAAAFTLNVTIPPGVTADVYVPSNSADSVTEGGQAAASAAGVKFVREENGEAVFAVGSGHYQFAAPLQ